MDHRLVSLGALAAVMLGPPLSAQQLSSGGTPPRITTDIAEAVRARPTPPRIDGVLDDGAWATAPLFSGFLQRDPDEGQPATEATEFQVVYTNTDLFVSVRAHDSRPDEIARILTRRDQMSPSDEITIMIDSYHDRRTGFSFSVNAAGVKRDAYLYDDNNRDDRWDAVWDVAVAVDDGGWTAEFQIPLTQLRFPADPGSFGFNVQRTVNRTNETQFWRLIPKEASGYVSEFGELTGIRGIRPPRQLEILPYTVARVERTPSVGGDPFRTGSAQAATAGADVKYGITSGLTLTATINPDFGQVEADPAVVNLSAFESFFPEKRPFFTEGLDLFRFRIADGDGDGSQEELFYTRRIGRRPQGEPDPRGGFAESVDHTTILAAGKLTGKTQSGWSVGLLGALTDEESADVVDATGASFRDVVEPRSGYAVGRLAREFRDGQTVLGFFGTLLDRAVPDRLSTLHSDAYSAGVNWSHRFKDNSYEFSGRVAASHVRGTEEAIAVTQQRSARYFQRPDADHLTFDPSRTSLSGYTAAMNVWRTAGDWRWAVGFDTRSPGFEVNDVGFQLEADRTTQFIWVNRRWLQPGKIFRRFNLNFNQWTGWTHGWERRFAGANLNGQFTLRNYWNGWFGANRNIRGLSVAALRGGPAMVQPGATNVWFGVGSDRRKAFHAGAMGFGFWQDDSDTRGGAVNLNLSWRPASNVEMMASPGMRWNRNQWQYLTRVVVGSDDEYVFGDLRQATASMTFRSSWTFTPALSLQVYAEPFVSTGRYEAYERVLDPRGERFADRFEVLDESRAVVDASGNVDIDLDGDGSVDAALGNPDFTVLSFRSNVVLRWEYLLGSTVFFVWQHGRSGATDDGRFGLGSSVGDIFDQPGENVVLVKVNYWLSR